MHTTHTIAVGPQDDQKRLDILLATFVATRKLGCSRTALQSMIKDGAVTVDGAAATKPHLRLKTGQVVELLLQEKKERILKGEDIPLEVIFEDDDVIVINKPAGLVVHPAPGNAEHTLVNALLHHCAALSDINPVRPGIVHRLDKDTSGVMVAAKNNPAHLHLAAQFAEHTIKRMYVALVTGAMEFQEHVIEMSIGRHPVHYKQMAVGIGRNPKHAKTYYRTVHRCAQASLVELHPFTGRTHQLRVHLAFLGHPILGDVTYGNKDSFSRLALHAKVLGFEHPRTGRFVEFKAPLPKEFARFIKKTFV
ncbi:MAG TPA: RluA family pseudouridine synthase [Candidatus Omnitrophota bacterium]|nr:RluA family pseudouridine synthase [Candidatus Omnitrophota bacterium]HRZ15264.1 RluA family pseudouridine synthase [Candidatus Omnitrophota bacterium]